MSTIQQLLDVKGTKIWSIGPKQTTYEALQLMADKNIGALLVIDKGELVGIFSERDYARRCTLRGNTSRNTTVGEIMTREVLCVNPHTTIQETMAIMSQKRIRHLPVCENGSTLGIVTIGDVVNQIILEQKFTIENLEHYIMGG